MRIGSFVIALAVLATGCGRSGTVRGAGAPTPAPDGALDLTIVASPRAVVRPGSFGVPVTVTLRNDDALAPAMAVRVQLQFEDGSGDRAADFVALELPSALGASRTVAPGATVEVPFEVEIVAHARRSDVTLSGRVDYLLGGSAYTDFAQQTDTWTFDGILDLVVNTTADEIALDAFVSLREALLAADATPGADRVLFDRAAFPQTGGGTITLQEELPLIASGHPVVIAGEGRVRLRASAGLAESGRWMLRVEDEAVVSGVTFENPGELYPSFDVTGDNCNGGEQEGGAIRAGSGGSVAIVDCVFDDGGVARRNCFANMVRLDDGSSGNRLVRNEFLHPAGDAAGVFDDTIEIRGNRVVDARDDGFIVTENSGPTKIVGNLFADVELSGLLVDGTDGAPLEISHNTFIRCRENGMRTFDPRAMTFRNNAFLGNVPAAIALVEEGANSTISHTAVDAAEVCTGCGEATVDDDTNLVGADLQFAAPQGTAWADFRPLAGSPLLDSAMDLHDVNGDAAGRFHGTGPDRGAVEASP